MVGAMKRPNSDDTIGRVSKERKISDTATRSTRSASSGLREARRLAKLIQHHVRTSNDREWLHSDLHYISRRDFTPRGRIVPDSNLRRFSATQLGIKAAVLKDLLSLKPEEGGVEESRHSEIREQQPFKFMELPTELRLEVYKHLFPNQIVKSRMVPWNLRSDYSQCHLAILRVSSTIYEEAYETLYRSVPYEVSLHQTEVHFVGQSQDLFQYYCSPKWSCLKDVKTLVVEFLANQLGRSRAIVDAPNVASFIFFERLAQQHRVHRLFLQLVFFDVFRRPQSTEGVSQHFIKAVLQTSLQILDNARGMRRVKAFDAHIFKRTLRPSGCIGPPNDTEVKPGPALRDILAKLKHHMNSEDALKPLPAMRPQLLAFRTFAEIARMRLNSDGSKMLQRICQALIDITQSSIDISEREQAFKRIQARAIKSWRACPVTMRAHPQSDSSNCSCRLSMPRAHQEHYNGNIQLWLARIKQLSPSLEEE